MPGANGLDPIVGVSRSRRRILGHIRDHVGSHADGTGMVALPGSGCSGIIRPAATMVIVAGLLDPRWKVEIEAEAVIAGG